MALVYFIQIWTPKICVPSDTAFLYIPGGDNRISELSTVSKPFKTSLPPIFFWKCSPILTELGILQVCSIRTSDLRISVCLATVGAAGSWDASHHHCLVAMTDVMPSGLGRGRRNTGELGKFTRRTILKTQQSLGISHRTFIVWGSPLWKDTKSLQKKTTSRSFSPKIHETVSSLHQTPLIPNTSP